MVEQIKIDAKSFITEKTGNIKDFYRITSCIGRGIHIIYFKYPSHTNLFIGAYGEVRNCQHKETK